MSSTTSGSTTSFGGMSTDASLTSSNDSSFAREPPNSRARLHALAATEPSPIEAAQSDPDGPLDDYYVAAAFSAAAAAATDYREAAALVGQAPRASVAPVPTAPASVNAIDASAAAAPDHFAIGTPPSAEPTVQKRALRTIQSSDPRTRTGGAPAPSHIPMPNQYIPASLVRNELSVVHEEELDHLAEMREYHSRELEQELHTAQLRTENELNAALFEQLSAHGTKRA